METSHKIESNICAAKEGLLTSDISQKALDIISQKSRIVIFPNKTILCYQDEPNEKFYLIREGKVKISKFTAEGKEITVEIISNGDVFGYVSLLKDETCECTVTTLTDTEMQVMNKYEFLNLVEEYPELFKGLLSSACRRLRSAYQHIETISASNVKQRVARILLEMARQEGEYKNNSLTFESRLTHQELANLAGTSRETVTRVLTYLKQKGFIKVSRSTVCILNEDEMEEGL